MQTKVSSAIWSDPDLEDAGPDIKLTIFWLLTNERRNCLGWVEVSARRFTYETGLQPTSLEVACKVLARGLVKTPRGIWIRNFIRFQFGIGPSLSKSNMRKTILKHLDECPEPSVIEEVRLTYPELFLSLDSESSSQAPYKGLPSPKEKEKENQKEKDKEIGKGVQRENPEWTIQSARARISRLFNRPEDKPWSNAEERALGDLWPFEEADLILIEHLHRSYAETLMPGEIDQRKRKIPTLLADWPSELDLARAFSRTHPIPGSSNLAKKKEGGAEPDRAAWTAWMARTYPKAEIPASFSALPPEIQKEFRDQTPPSPSTNQPE